MKAIYKFEEELIEKYGEELEPINEGYNIDDLNTEDRAFIGGMLWALKALENAFYNHVEEQGEKSLISQIKKEIAKDFLNEIERYMLCDIHEHTIGMIESYPEGGESDE